MAVIEIGDKGIEIEDSTSIKVDLGNGEYWSGSYEDMIRKLQSTEAHTWDCSCGETDIEGRFCPECLQGN